MNYLGSGAGIAVSVLQIAGKIADLVAAQQVTRARYDAATSVSERSYYFSEITRIDNEIIKLQIDKRNLEKGDMDAMTKTLITGGALIAGLLMIISLGRK